MNKKEKLQLIADKISQCQRCSELCVNRLKTVPGDGNPDTKIVLLGEGPGKDESEQGIPFCGRSGRLLTNILTACGIQREDVFIANILKCRPPNNRTPSSEEAQNCRPFLDLQLKVIVPKYIVCLGTCAAQNLLGVDTPISKMRGKWHEYKGIKVLPTFHPSYLLRNPSAKKDVWNDLQLLLSELK
jgi:uracil-DNA glycosylase